MRAVVIGGGMIVHDQILPSLYQLQREGILAGIDVWARRRETLDRLAANRMIGEAFPGYSFQPRLEPYSEVLASAGTRQLAVVALPDHLHFDAIMAALRADQHVLCVKPLVLRVEESETIEREARTRDLLVAVEYHKRFDDRALMARRRYRAGDLGEFRLGAGWLLEKWHYRESNFQNWFSHENSDAFTYVGCHYVDLVAFITGLEPVAVSIYGIPDRFPNGVDGYLWTDARIIWSNGACLNVQNALGYPDAGPGSNAQGLTLYGSGGRGTFLRHSDQYRGVELCGIVSGYSEPSPDYFQYVEHAGPGLRPAGYGYRSILAIADAVAAVNAGNTTPAQIEDRGLIATPANSRYNERAIEAGRRSIREDGRMIRIV